MTRSRWLVALVAMGAWSVVATAGTGGASGIALAGPGDEFVLGGDARRGHAVYIQRCAPCHGVRGDGRGPAGLALDPRPADLTDATRMDRLSDHDLYRIIRDGGQALGKSPLMVPWRGTLSDQQIRDVAAFVRTLTER